MRPDKRTLLVIGMLLVIVAFIIIYAMMILADETTEQDSLEEPQVPELRDEQKHYDSRLEAVDELNEQRSQTPPGLYNEKLITEEGNYDPYLEEKEKVALMDSILKSGPELQEYIYEEPYPPAFTKPIDSLVIVSGPQEPTKIGIGHSGFFLPGPDHKISVSFKPIRVMVNGDQVVSKDERLELRLTEPVITRNDTIPKNTILYAFCRFQPNRLLLEVHEVSKLPLELEAYDISDGQKGIYIENSFRSQATKEVLDDLIQGVNISGIPQVSGLKGIFQRSNRNVKVKVLHQYQLYLKPKL